MKDLSDTPSHHEQMLLSWSYILLTCGKNNFIHYYSFEREACLIIDETRAWLDKVDNICIFIIIFMSERKYLLKMLYIISFFKTFVNSFKV